MRRTLFDDDHEAFRASVHGILGRELVPRAEQARHVAEVPVEVWRALGDAGALGVMVPEEHGGGGVADFRYHAVLGEELVVHGVAYASSIGINTDVVLPYLLELATPEAQARWLPPFCAGELITAIGMTEPGAGSDLSGITTRATRVDGGWLVTGSKTFITNGARAGLVVTAARTSEGRRGLTLFGVEAATPGFRRGRKLDKVGQPEADTAEIFLDDVFVPDAHVIGQVDQGFGAMLARLPQERLSVALVGVAHARHMLDLTVVYAGERQAFGQAIGAFQNSRFVLADLATQVDVAQSFVDDCLRASVAGELDAIDAAKAKLFATELQGRVADACVQLHGGYGYMREESIARSWLDARVTRIWAGSSEIMREVIGRSLGA